MATPVYGTDLIDIDTADSSVWVEPTASGWTSLFQITTAETDYFIQGVACTSGSVKTGVGGLMTPAISDKTFVTDGAVLNWAKFDAPNSLDTIGNGGIRTIIGNSQTVFYGYSHLGRDTYTYGGWVCLASGDPAESSIVKDYTVGTGQASPYQRFGWAYNCPTSVPSKGNPFGADAIRMGRCELRVNGGDTTFGYATFAQMANYNDANSIVYTGTLSSGTPNITAVSDNSKLYIGAPITGTGIPGGTTITNIPSATTLTISQNATASGAQTLTTAPYNRLGLFQVIEGGYKWQGLMTLGFGSAVDFRDSNKSIVVANTRKVTANFNKIEVKQAGSRVDWTNISITGLGTVSRGRFECIDDADINWDGCTFTDMGTFIFQATSTILNSTFRRCNKITTGGAPFTGCLFTRSNDSSIAVTVPSPAAAALISNSDFISTGTGHGLEITGSVADITLTNNTWTDYATIDGSTGNEAVYVNTSAGSMTINIVGGTRPSVRAAAGVNLTVNSGVAMTVTVRDIVTGSLIPVARVLVKAATGGDLPFEESVTEINRVSSTATVDHTGHGLEDGKKVLIKGAVQLEYNGVFVITYIDTNSYSYTVSGTPDTPATGTITATAVIIDGDTTSGVITDTRDYSTSQPISGIVRKSSASPYYISAPISGTIDSGSGLSVTTLMIPDE